MDNAHLYIGEKLVVRQLGLDGDRVEITFDDKSVVVFPRKMFEASYSFEPTDATELQKKRVIAVQAEFMTLLLSWDMKLQDIFVLLNWSNNYLNDKHELADEKLWGNTNRERTIGDLERVLQTKSDTSDPLRAERGGAASQGAGPDPLPTE